ncbi:hypothetical protein SAMN04487886_12992 [Clostridium sp. DSM 8431]|nr:hypothetical protein [Clostridium sp. DSM 8431]SFU89956.1 hypothetical protein SAMN04487886_12992 [Clostridium sp. DSM 8431]
MKSYYSYKKREASNKYIFDEKFRKEIQRCCNILIRRLAKFAYEIKNPYLAEEEEIRIIYDVHALDENLIHDLSFNAYNELLNRPKIKVDIF